MWESSGYEVTRRLDEADIVNFLGGHDVSPCLYDESKLPCTYNSIERDDQESQIFNAVKAMKKFMVGICRGGQFLNVMNGGKMWQDVNNHTRSHLAMDIMTGCKYEVTSTHHQMMRPAPKGVIVMVAEEATKKIAANDKWEKGEPEEFPDIEAVWYPDTSSLCFQPHPEFYNNECRHIFRLYMQRYYDIHYYLNKKEAV